jgi:hypothetical protein
MGRSSSREDFGSTDLFRADRNDVIPPSRDNLADARLPQRPCAQDRCGNDSDRYMSSSELQAFRAGYRQAYGDGYADAQRQLMRVGGGQGSYCPDYDDYAIRRQVNSQVEAWRNHGDDFRRYPIPNCRQQYQRQGDYSYDYSYPRYGDVRAVSAGDYDYDRRYGHQGGNLLDRIFQGVGQVARGIGDVLYEAQPLIQTWAQIEMVKQGGRMWGWNGNNNNYFGRPFNPWNTPQNRGLIDYHNRYAYSGNYNPPWLYL